MVVNTCLEEHYIACEWKRSIQYHFEAGLHNNHQHFCSYATGERERGSMKFRMSKRQISQTDEALSRERVIELSVFNSQEDFGQR